MKNKNRADNGNSNKNELYIKERFNYTEKQKSILEISQKKEVKSIFIDGLWGSGKSFIAVLIALKLLSQKKVNGILYVRNPIESSSTSRIGFIPGTIEEKMLPYNQIFFDKLNEFISKSEIEKLIIIIIKKLYYYNNISYRIFFNFNYLKTLKILIRIT
jgi:phosphate starvation-inducible PhoH-like protein